MTPIDFPSALKTGARDGPIQFIRQGAQLAVADGDHGEPVHDVGGVLRLRALQHRQEPAVGREGEVLVVGRKHAGEAARHATRPGFHEIDLVPAALLRFLAVVADIRDVLAGQGTTQAGRRRTPRRSSAP